jgi:large conductance mechanosensitive channel
MGMIAEFREFIKRGNVLDLAVGVIIGGAFGKIVSSVTDDLIMPVVSLFTKSTNFSDWFIALDGQSYPDLATAKKAGVATLNYGNFISATVNFLIIAFVVFIIVKQVNRVMPKAPPPPPPGPTPDQALLMEIRDLLKQQR